MRWHIIHHPPTGERDPLNAGPVKTVYVYKEENSGCTNMFVKKSTY